MTGSPDRAKALFLAALDLPAGDRRAFLADACGGDTALLREVRSLLAFHEEDATRAGAAGDAEAEPFVTGDVFAGRYRMIARIGRGGMGDVWRADDMVLETPVALKLITSTDPDARARILNEVRLARQITHGGVCRVFDVGEAGGEIFLSMELVHGEDLATLLRRSGRLPSEKVADIGRQLCAGIAAAHACGVLHRDLKPANILIDDRGLVRITDFGIAITRRDTARHTLIGTPGYMAPEQQTRGTNLSEQTDLYALGVVLYELLVGRHPADVSGSSGAVKRPSTLVSNVDPQLERVIIQALSADPRQRPRSADEMGESLPDTFAGPGPDQAMRWPMWAAVAAAIIAVGIALPFVFTSRARALTAQDVIVLADFENATGEPVFDGALQVALAVGLEQSPFMKVFPEERIREVLGLMHRSPDERVTREIAREIAERETLKALIAGSIASLGRNYVIALEAVNAATGDVMAREQVEAASKEQVLTALGSATSSLRQKLGESLASIQRFDVPLPRATTPSLEALQAYALALDQGRVVPRLETIPHLRRAIEIDPDFALAHALLAGFYNNTGQSELAPQYARRAFDLRDRVSERERFFISWRYYRDAALADEKSLELAKAWAATYPRETLAFNSVGLAALTLGRFEEAVAPLQEAIRLDAKFYAPYGNLGSAYMALNRFDEARALMKAATDEHIEAASVHQIGYMLALIDGDSAAMSRHLEGARRGPQPAGALVWPARTSAFKGRLGQAHTEFREAEQLAMQRGLNEVAAQFHMQDAEAHAHAGQCDEGRDDVSAGLALSRDRVTLERAGRVLGLCGADREFSLVSSELAARYPEATTTVRVGGPTIAAAMAIGRHAPSRAIEILEPVRNYDRAPTQEYWPEYLRGLAYLHLKDGPRAAVEFQKVVSRRGQAPDSAIYPHATLGLARAAALAGETARARQAYDDFFALWADADSTLPPLVQARQEYGRLQ